MFEKINEYFKISARPFLPEGNKEELSAEIKAWRDPNSDLRNDLDMKLVQDATIHVGEIYRQIQELKPTAAHSIFLHRQRNLIRGSHPSPMRVSAASHNIERMYNEIGEINRACESMRQILPLERLENLEAKLEMYNQQHAIFMAPSVIFDRAARGKFDDVSGPRMMALAVGGSLNWALKFGRVHDNTPDCH